MKLFVKMLVLWPKNHDLKPRVIPFKEDSINVITGASGTGKSTVTSIIDYCLGSHKCAIPVGLIREKCEWYGLVLKTGRGEMLVARHDPGTSQTTGDMYVEERAEIEIPPVIGAKNVNVELFKDMMDRAAEIPHVDMGDTTRFDPTNAIYPAFRDMAAFNFQPQHIVANPYTLFFKTDTMQHREKLRNILPFVFGSVTPQMLVQQKELHELEKELKRLQLELDERTRASEKWLGEIEAYYIQARKLGLLPQGTDDRTGWSPERYVQELCTVKGYLEEHPIPVTVPGAGETYAEELNKVVERESQLSCELDDMTRRLGKMKSVKTALGRFRDAETEQRDRLSSVGWLGRKLRESSVCPVCSAYHDQTGPALTKLFSVVAEFEEISRGVQAAPSQIDVDIVELGRLLRAKEEEYNAIRSQHLNLEKRNREIAKRRQEVNATYHFAGRLEQALESFSPSGAQSELRERIEEMKGRVSTLRSTVNSNLTKARFEAALGGISRTIGEYARFLELERAADNVALDPRELSVKFNRNGRIDYLWEIGSGQNWVGYHLATLLAIQHHQLSLPQNPVPAFLVIDQPSQVYFPESSWGTIETNPTSSLSNDVSEDIKGVRRIFGVLKRFLDEHPGAFQVIVTEHAGKVTWEGLDESINVVGNWREGEDDYLIPRDWM